MDPGIVQLILTTGAAGVLLYILKLVVDGKLHTDSEVAGLKQDKAELATANRELRTAVNDEIMPLLRDILEVVTAPDEQQGGP